MSLHGRKLLADEIHATQPNLFFSVLALQGFGATIEEMKVVLNILLVFCSAMKMSGTAWPVVSEEVQDRGLERITALARFIEGHSPRQQERATADSIARHTQPQRLAYVFGKLTEHALNTVKTEAEKMIMLVAVNMVECIALTAPTKAKAKSPKRRAE